MIIVPFHRVCPSAVAAVWLVFAGSVNARCEADDAHALNQIFGDDHLADNVFDTRNRAAAMSPEERFEFLSSRLLPGSDRSKFRIPVDFTQTQPAPALDATVRSGFRVATGGEVVSPALDLIDTAKTLGRLDELRSHVEEAAGEGLRFQIDRMALLVLVDMARDDLPSARSLLTELLALVLSDASAMQSDAALVCVHAAAADRSLSRVVVDPAFRILTSYQRTEKWSAWQRQFAAAYARAIEIADIDDAGTAIATASTPFTRWSPASPPRARYRGAGCPPARWIMQPGHVVNRASHDEDLLYYASPLAGDFEVEWDITAFGWRTSELLIGGRWVVALHDHETYKVGGLRDTGWNRPITPRLSRVDDFIHYRSVVRNGTVTTWVNGREIHNQSLSSGNDPWLAIRSTVRQDGSVRNLKLSGDPVVPDQVRLAEGANLIRWLPYFEGPVGGGRRPGEIHLPRRPELPRGCHQESAVFYHRPMLEDGSLEYQFWYDPDVCTAHPALDRLCFVMDPLGVKVHWLTDGPFDRTLLPPDNLSDEPDDRRGHGRLPLMERAWNDLRLSVQGDTVELWLNGEFVYQCAIEPTNQRHFGLFHYADRTELRVRNVIWTGDWPRDIPEVGAQELAIDEAGFLDERLPELTATFTHDFDADGLRPARFAVIQGELPAHITTGPDGLHMMRRGVGDGYITANVAANLSVRGDFDITASFDRLVPETNPGGSSTVCLLTAADTGDECLMMRRRVWRTRDQQVIQCQRVRYDDDEARRRFFAHRTVEAPSGTLRLARRDETVYYLFAENDSRQFQLIGEESFPADDLPLQGVRLILQAHGDDTSTSVVWKNLTVRAEELAGPAIDGAAGLFLNHQQEQ